MQSGDTEQAGQQSAPCGLKKVPGENFACKKVFATD